MYNKGVAKRSLLDRQFAQLQQDGHFWQTMAPSQTSWARGPPNGVFPVEPCPETRVQMTRRVSCWLDARVLMTGGM